MSDSVRPQRRQPTRLPRPWDSAGKNTGVGCHFLLQCMKVKSESEVAQSCPTPSNPMDCSLPGSSIHGIFQTRVLEWVASKRYLFSNQLRGSSSQSCTPGLGCLKGILNSMLRREDLQACDPAFLFCVCLPVAFPPFLPGSMWTVLVVEKSLCQSPRHFQ